MEIDWSEAPEWATHALTTGPDWDGDRDIVGAVCFARLDHGVFWDDNGTKFIKGLSSWVVSDSRIKENIDSHYNKTAKLRVTHQDAEKGYVEIKLDPHLVSVAIGMNGGPLEHIFKKAWRGTDKGHDLITVYKEIRALCDRAIEIDECLVE